MAFTATTSMSLCTTPCGAALALMLIQDNFLVGVRQYKYAILFPVQCFVQKRFADSCFWSRGRFLQFRVFYVTLASLRFFRRMRSIAIISEQPFIKLNRNLVCYQQVYTTKSIMQEFHFPFKTRRRNGRMIFQVRFQRLQYELRQHWNLTL